jgi:hypothetical protein
VQAQLHRAASPACRPAVQADREPAVARRARGLPRRRTAGSPRPCWATTVHAAAATLAPAVPRLAAGMARAAVQAPVAAAERTGARSDAGFREIKGNKPEAHDTPVFRVPPDDRRTASPPTEQLARMAQDPSPRKMAVGCKVVSCHSYPLQ